jgi:hypothetical protein
MSADCFDDMIPSNATIEARLRRVHRDGGALLDPANDGYPAPPKRAAGDAAD